MTKNRRSTGYWILQAIAMASLLGLVFFLAFFFSSNSALWYYPIVPLLGTVAFLLGCFSPSSKEDHMRCPDCGHDIVVKPEVVVENVPCECGMTSEVRIFRYLCVAFVALVLALFGGCWVDAHYNSEKAKYVAQSEERKAVQPEKK